VNNPRTVQSLVDAIIVERERQLANQITNQPQTNIRASSIPTCQRQGYYSIVHWDERKLHDTRLQARFEEGKRQEQWVVNELASLGQRLGFNVIESQVPLSKDMTDRYHLTGHIDGKIEFDGRRIPFEVKSLNPNFFDGVNTVDDLKGDVFLARYYRQIQVYLLGHNESEAVLIVTDCLGHWKFIVVPLDYDETERILQTVEAVNKAVASKTIPDRIKYDPDICGWCPFSHICLPDVIAEARVHFADDPTLLAAITRHEELKPLVKEYETLHDKLAEQVKGKPLVAVGDFIIEGKPQRLTKYEIPDEIKAPFKKVSEFWRWTIKRQNG
jgi:CRISPR/Cas system-associated exonuclease Cas4 (RecB family)